VPSPWTGQPGTVVALSSRAMNPRTPDSGGSASSPCPQAGHGHVGRGASWGEPRLDRDAIPSSRLRVVPTGKRVIAPTTVLRPTPPAPVLPPHARGRLTARPLGRRLGWLLLCGPAVLFAAAPRASAHGVPEKVVDDLVVSVVLIRVHDTNALRFFFRDPRSGRPLAIPVTFRVHLRDEATGAQVEESPRLTTMIGRGEFVPRIPRAGLHEVLLEVERADRPGRIYRPEDWLVEMGEPGPAVMRPGGWMLVLGLGVLAAFVGWRGIRHRQSGLGAHEVLA
jgi:hypothetical protein